MQQQDVNHYEVRGRVVKLSRLRRTGAAGKPSLQMRVETLAFGDGTPVVHVVCLGGELAEKAYYEACLGDTVHVGGELRVRTWRDNGTERSATYLEANWYRFVAMSEEWQAIRNLPERADTR